MPNYKEELWDRCFLDFLEPNFLYDKYSKKCFSISKNFLCKLENRFSLLYSTGKSISDYRACTSSAAFHNDIVRQTDLLVKSFQINQIWYEVF